MWVLSETNEWKWADKSTDVKLESMLQRMQLFKYESSFNYEDGVDYPRVLNKQDFILPQLEKIANDYLKYFANITIIDVVNNDRLEVKIEVTLLNGQTITRSIFI